MAKIRLKLNTDIAKEVFPHELSKAEIRQLQIMEQTIRLCAKDGVEALSYGKIAEACGVSRHLVIHYFPDHDSLVQNATEIVWSSLKLAILKRTDEAVNATEKMSVYLTANLEWARSSPDYAKFFLLFLHFASTKTAFKKTSSTLFSLGQNRILGIMNQGIKEGVFRKPAHPELRAKSIQIAVLGHVVSLVSEDQLFTMEELDKELRQSVLGGLSK